MQHDPLPSALCHDQHEAWSAAPAPLQLPESAAYIADSAFTIGEGHRVCEDYSLAGIGAKGAYAIVSDGCSSSEGTDVGARLLVLAAKHQLDRGRFCPFRALHRAASVARRLGLDDTALDATLMVAHRDGPKIHIWAAGDGAVVAVDREGQAQSWLLEHPTGAPAYLSYGLNRSRREAYLSAHPDRHVHHERRGARSTRVSRVADSFVWSTSLSAASFCAVALLSDGITSFRESRATHPRPVSYLEVLQPLLDFKVLRGSFVQRRLRRFSSRECPRRGWRHDDDLSIAALVEDQP